jgi:ABC-2 type transport system permease protein
MPWLLIRVNLLQLWRKVGSVHRQSLVHLLALLLFVLVYMWLAYWLVNVGLRFLQRFPGLGTLLMERMFYLLFALLFFLLLTSNLIIGFSNFFRSREVAFLLPLPLSHQQVFRWKFLESVVLASWAFLFLIAPILAAFGRNFRVDAGFYLVTPVLLCLFLLIPGVLGAAGALALGRYVERRTFQMISGILLVGVIAAAAVMLKPVPVSDEMLENRELAVLDRLLFRTRFAHLPWLPSYWISASLLGWIERAGQAAVFFAGVLLSYAALFGTVIMTRFGSAFYHGWSEVQSRGGSRRKEPSRNLRDVLSAGKIERFLNRLWVSPQATAIVAKDFRLFWRDTSQWGQTLVLFGLLAIYILNLKQFSQQLTSNFWLFVISYLNLAACSLNMATLTTRFVFPQISLEGLRIWILGMAPLGLPRVLGIKFLSAGSAGVLLTSFLIVLSCRLINLPWEYTLYLGGAVVIITLSLTGLALGLGTLFPNFREENPSKIVSGMGGTLCLVLSFFYILLGVAAVAYGSPWSMRGRQNPDRILIGAALFILLSILIGALPMWLAGRRVQRLEC